MRKNGLETIFKLIFFTKKIFSKNFILLAQSIIEKTAITIL